MQWASCASPTLLLGLELFLLVHPAGMSERTRSALCACWSSPGGELASAAEAIGTMLLNVASTRPTPSPAHADLRQCIMIASSRSSRCRPHDPAGTPGETLGQRLWRRTAGQRGPPSSPPHGSKQVDARYSATPTAVCGSSPTAKGSGPVKAFDDALRG